jgi:hypothetical protein
LLLLWIKYILCKYCYYTKHIIYSNKNKEGLNYRCVNIDKYINLDNIIYNHINQYYLKKYKKYYYKIYKKEVSGENNMMQNHYNNYIKYKKEYYEKKINNG